MSQYYDWDICLIIECEDLLNTTKTTSFRFRFDTTRQFSLIFHDGDLISQLHTESQKITNLPYIGRWNKDWINHIAIAHEQVAYQHCTYNSWFCFLFVALYTFSGGNVMRQIFQRILKTGITYFPQDSIQASVQKY